MSKQKNKSHDSQDSDDDDIASRKYKHKSAHIKQKISVSQASPNPVRRVQPYRKVRDVPVSKKIAKAIKLPPAKKNGIHKKQAAPVPQNAVPLPKKSAPPPKKAAQILKQKVLAAKKSVCYNFLDLLVRVMRDNVCIFYIIGTICLFSSTHDLLIFFTGAIL